MTAGENVVATPSPDKWFFTRWAESAVDLIKEYRGNPIKPSLKAGNYTPDTTAAPFESLRAYKGRSLNGIWATAPYLHNGSVPTLRALMFPEERPAVFFRGYNVYDWDRGGFIATGPDAEKAGVRFDTTLKGNGNGGHLYGTNLPAADREAIIEYLKTL